MGERRSRGRFGLEPSVKGGKRCTRVRLRSSQSSEVCPGARLLGELQQRSEGPSRLPPLFSSLFLLPLPASVRGLQLAGVQWDPEFTSYSGISNDFETTLLLSAPSVDVPAASSQGQCCSFSPNHGPKTPQPLSWGPRAPCCCFLFCPSSVHGQLMSWKGPPLPEVSPFTFLPSCPTWY